MTRVATLLVLLLTCLRHNSLAQEVPGHRFIDFIQSNETFGHKILGQVHMENRDKNVVIAPLPIYYILGAMGRGSLNGATQKEIWHALDWDRGVSPFGPSRLLFERFRPFEPEESKPSWQSREHKTGNHAGTSLSRSQESMWMRTAFIYRGSHTIYDSFLHEATGEFGMQIVNVAQSRDIQGVAKQWWVDYVPKPQLVGPSDFYAVGLMHLQTVWAGNTFSKATTRKEDFILQSGARKAVDTMHSELSSYSHARTDNFEAVILRCYAVNLLIVLPAEGKDLLDLEKRLVDDPGMIDSALKREPGTVEVPKFKLQFETDLRPVLENLGVHRIFASLDFVKIPNSTMKQLKQRVEIELDEEGIRANAGTLANGVYGGVMGGPVVPFHLKVNKPFLFLIRDDLTGSLIFIGAVMNPEHS